MKWLRKLLAILALFVVVCAFVITSLIVFIDPNKLKPIIIEEVMKGTGYKLAVEGNLSWSFYPLLGIKMDHMTLSAADRSDPFVDAHGVTIATEFWSLLHGNEKLRGSIYISQLNLLQLHAEHVRMGLHWQNNVLNLQSISASMYGGLLTGHAQGHELSAIPHWSWEVTMDGVQLKQLMTDMSGPNNKIKITGVGQIKLQAETQGKNKDQLFNNLNGTSEFNLNNGTIEGIDLNYLVQSADALLDKQLLPVRADISQTAFERLTGMAVIKNGMANTENLHLVSPAFTMRAQGNVDLLNQILDFRLLITPVHTTQLKWPVPVLVDGHLYDPSVRLDMLTLKTLLAREEIEKIKTKVEEQIKQLPERAEKILHEFLGQ